MKCKKIKGILMTDYLDAQADEATCRDVEDHLAQCAHCRQYAEEMRQTVVEPFKQIREINPPERVWAGIREKIQSQQQSECPVDSVDFGEWLRTLLSPQRLPLWVPVMAIFLVFLIAQVLGMRKTANEHLAIGTYLVTESDTFSTNSTESDIASSGFGTVIEEYFI